MSQMELVDFDSLLPSTHPYRRFQAYLPDITEALVDVSQLTERNPSPSYCSFKNSTRALSLSTQIHSLMVRRRF